MIFHHRRQAGQLLGQQLQKYKKENCILLALPRGGVPIAAEISAALSAPMDVLLVRKIGAPFQSELAVGAICEEDEPIWNSKLLCQMGLEPDDLARTVDVEREKIKRQLQLFRGSRNLPSLAKTTVILVDDGLATGATMFTAIKYLKKKGAIKTIVAVPVAAKSSSLKLKNKVDEVVTLEEPEDLVSVGQWYEDFSQVTDEEVITLLKKNVSRLRE